MPSLQNDFDFMLGLYETLFSEYLTFVMNDYTDTVYLVQYNEDNDEIQFMQCNQDDTSHIKECSGIAKKILDIDMKKVYGDDGKLKGIKGTSNIVNGKILKVPATSGRKRIVCEFRSNHYQATIPNCTLIGVYVNVSDKTATLHGMASVDKVRTLARQNHGDLQQHGEVELVEVVDIDSQLSVFF